MDETTVVARSEGEAGNIAAYNTTALRLIVFNNRAALYGHNHILWSEPFLEWMLL